MRDATQLSEAEAQFVNWLVKLYPKGAGYSKESDATVREQAAALVHEGRIERIEEDAEPQGPFAVYRLTDAAADQIRETAKAKSEAARFN